MPQTTSTKRRRRTQEEIADLLAEYATSGLSRAAFCQTQQLSLATLARYLERAGSATGDRVTNASFVAVELDDPTTASSESGLALLLPGGRRLLVQRGFCADTRHHLLSVLERR